MIWYECGFVCCLGMGYNKPCRMPNISFFLSFFYYMLYFFHLPERFSKHIHLHIASLKNTSIAQTIDFKHKNVMFQYRSRQFYLSMGACFWSFYWYSTDMFIITVTLLISCILLRSGSIQLISVVDLFSVSVADSLALFILKLPLWMYHQSMICTTARTQNRQMWSAEG